MQTPESSIPHADDGAWRKRIGDAGEQTLDFIRERPLTAILLAVAAGYLVGRILR